jgi:hypothetical protein
MEKKLETHQEALERLQLQVGDTVKIIEKAESNERGWNTCWINTMDKNVGQTGIITSISYDGISVKTGNFGSAYYPAYILEVVSRATDKESVTTKAPMTVLEEAQSLIYGDREKDYGKTSDNFVEIAKGWEVIAKAPLTPEQVALMMIWLKVCRANKDNCEKRDSYVDIAGYAGCIEKVKKGI